MNKVILLAQNGPRSLNRLLAEPGNQSGHLQLAPRTLYHPHMRHPDLLDELELKVLGHRVRLAHAKYVGDDVLCGVSKAPKTAHDGPEKQGMVLYNLPLFLIERSAARM